MIDTDKYQGHYKASWANQYGDVVKLVYPNESSPSLDADQRLIIDAPLLLAEVKRLRKQLEDCKRQIQFTADWIRDRGEDTHAKELDEFLEWME